MALSPVSELVGRVLAGRYRLTAPVGTGASAQVFVADDVQLRRRVAVKVLHPALAQDPTFLRRFQAEAQAAAALNHPNVVAVYDWGEDSVPFLVTEYLEGGNLRGMLDAVGSLTVSQALVVGLEAARGLHYAHSRGFVHRDVKPANLLFGDDSRLRVADFGLARALAEAAWTEPEGVVLGTARYVSPEQAAGGSLDGKSDIYSLALVLVECVTGRVPHAADTAIGSLQARIGRSIDASAELGPLAPIIEAAGRADPAERSSAADLGRALMAAAADLPSPEPLPLAPPKVTLLSSSPGRGRPTGDRHQGTPDANGQSEYAARSAADAVRTHDPTAIFVAEPIRGEPPPPPPPPPPAAAPARKGRRRRRREEAGAVDRPSRRARREARRARPRRRRVYRWVAGVLFLAALATLAMIVASLLRGPGSPKLVVVPELIGVSDKDVSAHLPPKAGWQIRYTDTRKDGTQPGQILAQDPAHGEMLLQGGVLQLTRSQGDELRNVDASAFVGASQSDAVAKLQSMGLKPEAVLAQKFDEQIPEGHVLQVLEAGKQVPKGGTVTLVISKGAEPRTLPDFAKQTPEQVKAALAQLGLQYAERQDYSESVETGKVIATEPAAGQQAPKGSAVTAVISIGRRPIAVANVIGMQAVDAANALEAQGFKVSTLGAPNRVVIATDPGPSEMRYRGDQVVIVTRQS